METYHFDHIRLDFKGPFSFLSHSAYPCVFDVQGSRKPGIYIFATNTNNGWFVNYVGQTGRTFRKRLREHVLDFLSGQERVYDPSDYLKGRKNVLWDGLWRRGRNYEINALVDNYVVQAQARVERLKVTNVFFAPLEATAEIREAIESQIALNIYSDHNGCAALMESDVRYISRSFGDSLNVEISSAANLNGLPKFMRL
ncbi:MAG: hypothetical protein Q4A28_02940 [Brachymonas sp.]|nr:hypothetical protein [Brachymonas sp.]